MFLSFSSDVMLIAFTTGSALLGLTLVITMSSQYKYSPKLVKHLSIVLEETRDVRHCLCLAVIAVIFIASLSTMVCRCPDLQLSYDLLLPKAFVSNSPKEKHIIQFIAIEWVSVGHRVTNRTTSPRANIPIDVFVFLRQFPFDISDRQLKKSLLRFNIYLNLSHL